MECQLTWSDQAYMNLKSIENYIAEDSPTQAKRVVNDIIHYTERLKTFPMMGQILPEYPQLGLRQFVKFSYRIIYSFKENIITVIAVVHGKQKYIEMNLHN